MVVDDAQLVVALVGVRGKTMCRQGVGNGLHGRAQTALAGDDIEPRHTRSHGLPVLLTDLFGHCLGLVAGQQGQCPAQQRQHEIIASHWDVDRDIGDRSIALRRPTRTRTLRPFDGDLEVTPRREAIEVMTGDIGVQPELFGHLRRRHAGLVLASEQVDAATRGVAECVGDGGNRRGEGT